MCAKAARGPAEMLIVNKLLGFHNSPQRGQDGSASGNPEPSEPERERGLCTVKTPPPDQRDGQKERKQSDKRVAPLKIWWDINEMILSRLRRDTVFRRTSKLSKFK